MRFSNFFKDKLLQIILLLFAIITIEIFLLAYRVDNFIRLYIIAVILGVYLITIIFEYYKKRKFYKNIQDTLNQLKEKYLITELIKEPNFVEGDCFKEILEQIDKSMYENVNKYKYLTKDYKE